jgi:hypothetical protein
LEKRDDSPAAGIKQLLFEHSATMMGTTNGSLRVPDAADRSTGCQNRTPRRLKRGARGSTTAISPAN